MDSEFTEIKVDIAEIKSDMKYVVASAKKMDDIKGKVGFHDWFCKVLIVCFSLASMVILLNNTFSAAKAIVGA